MEDSFVLQGLVLRITLSFNGRIEGTYVVSISIDETKRFEYTVDGIGYARGGARHQDLKYYEK